MTTTQEEVKVPGYLRFSKVVVWVLYFWVMIGIVSLTLRVFLLAFSASQSAGFTEFVMKVSNDYLQPFRGIFPPKPVGETGYLDVSSLFAIVVYLFVAWGISALTTYVQHKIDSTTMEQKQKIAEAKRQTQVQTARPRTQTAATPHKIS